MTTKKIRKNLSDTMHKHYRERPNEMVKDSLDESGLSCPAESLADTLKLKANTVYKWTYDRRPDEVINPGNRSPIETMFGYFQWWLLYSPVFCEIYIQILQDIRDEHVKKIVALSGDPEEIKLEAIRAGHGFAEAVAGDAEPDEIEMAASQVQASARQVVASCEPRVLRVHLIGKQVTDARRQRKTR